MLKILLHNKTSGYYFKFKNIFYVIFDITIADNSQCYIIVVYYKTIKVDLVSYGINLDLLRKSLPYAGLINNWTGFFRCLIQNYYIHHRPCE